MMSKLVILAACLLSVAPGQMAPPSQQSPRTDCWTIVGEGCAGLVGGAKLGSGGAIVGAIIGFGFSRAASPFDLTEEELVGAGFGAGAGILLGTTIGTYAFGQARNQGGRWGPTFLGALSGTAAGALAIYGAKRAPVIQLVGVLMPATGAVIGYNQSRPEPANGSSFLDRLDHPSVALVPNGCRLEPPCLDVRLLNMRF